jgi:hypothetical protein
MADKEISDKILHNLAQVQDIIDDALASVQKIKRETPDAVPVRFRVYGEGPFPIDMLRFDGCVPDEDLDAAMIERSFSPEHGGRMFVALRKLSIGQPSYARWAEKGWKVD